MPYVGLLLDRLLMVHIDGRVERWGVNHWHSGLHLLLLTGCVAHSLLLWWLLHFWSRVVGDHLRLLLRLLLGELSRHRAKHLLLLTGSSLIVASRYLLLLLLWCRDSTGRLQLCLSSDELRLLYRHILLLTDWLLWYTLLLLLFWLLDHWAGCLEVWTRGDLALVAYEGGHDLRLYRRLLWPLVLHHNWACLVADV